MACGKTGQPITKRLRATTTVPQFEPFGDWIPAVGVDAVKMVIKRKSVLVAGTTPSMHFKQAMQIALVRPDEPGTWGLIGAPSAMNGAGEDNTGVLNIAQATAGNFFVRFGVQYYLGGGAPTDGQADVEVQVSYVSCGRIVGTMTQELQAFNTTDPSHVAITGWIPAIDVEAVVAAIVVSNIANAFGCLVVYRKAATSIQAPGTWTALTGPNEVTANGETTTLERTVTATDDMFVQFGLRFRQTTAGSAPGQATVSTAVAVRRA